MTGSHQFVARQSPSMPKLISTSKFSHSGSMTQTVSNFNIFKNQQLLIIKLVSTQVLILIV